MLKAPPKTPAPSKSKRKAKLPSRPSETRKEEDTLLTELDKGPLEA
jgi:hypothetical protein